MFRSSVGRLQIRLGDQDVDYDPLFSIKFTTKIANPHYPPELSIKITLINFTVTIDGLEEQLLNTVAEHEMPDLVARRQDLTRSLQDDKMTLIELEEKVLRLLSATEDSSSAAATRTSAVGESKPNILDDVVLCRTLEEAKKTSTEVETRVAESEQTAKRLAVLFERYRPLAERGSILYFAIADLAAIDSMYQFSLLYFTKLFVDTLVRTPKPSRRKVGSGTLSSPEKGEGSSPMGRTLSSPEKGGDGHGTNAPVSKAKTTRPPLTLPITPRRDKEQSTSESSEADEEQDDVDPNTSMGLVEERLARLIAETTRVLFRNVCRGLFAKHKLVFAFSIATAVHRREGHITVAEWNLLLRGVPVTLANQFSAEQNAFEKDKVEVSEDENVYLPPGEVLSDKQWLSLFGVERVCPMKNLLRHIKMNKDDWMNWADLDQPHLQKLPDNLEEKWEMRYFQKILLIHCFCPDLVLLSCQEYIQKSMGTLYTKFGSGSAADLEEILFPNGGGNPGGVGVSDSDAEGGQNSSARRTLSPSGRGGNISMNSPGVNSSMSGSSMLESSGSRLHPASPTSHNNPPSQASSNVIIFILSPGADAPTAQIEKLAVQMNKKLDCISLGQGQGPRAQRLIEQGRRSDHRWVLLQNCHLLKSWMPTLERIGEMLISSAGSGEINASPTGGGGATGRGDGISPGGLSAATSRHEGVDASFRLFLTSMPCAYFPISLLQNGIKLTTEPPAGIKANVRRSLAQKTEEDFNPLSLNQREQTGYRLVFAKLQYGLLLFHALIQERKRFGPLGWSTRYDFNESDLEAACVNAANTLLAAGSTSSEGISDKTSSGGGGSANGGAPGGVNYASNVPGSVPKLAVPWETLSFVLGEINYGGRVTDEWDRRLLKATLEMFVTPHLPKSHYKYAGLYRLPPPKDIQAMREHADTSSSDETGSSLDGTALAGGLAGAAAAPAPGAGEHVPPYASKRQTTPDTGVAYCWSDFWFFTEAVLPETDLPEIFGLHENAMIACQQRESDMW